MIVDVRTRTFVYNVAGDCRMRHFHRRSGKTVLGFVVQLEILHPTIGTWTPIIRYDTAHNFVHKDLIHPNDLVEKTPLPIDDYGQALYYAETDLKDNWQSYRTRFLEELKDEKREQTS